MTGLHHWGGGGGGGGLVMVSGLPHDRFASGGGGACHGHCHISGHIVTVVALVSLWWLPCFRYHTGVDTLLVTLFLISHRC